jgi:succinyl-CoA synthetase beta subunit
MLLYHGSNVAVVKPQLLAQTRGLDFGAGFYLTSNEIQAQTFAEIIINRRKKGSPTISVKKYVKSATL